MPPQLDPQMLAMLSSGAGAPGPAGAAGDPTMPPTGAPPSGPTDDPLLAAISGTSAGGAPGAPGGGGGDFPSLDAQTYMQILGPAMAQGATGLIQALPAIEQLKQASRQLLEQQEEQIIQQIIAQLMQPQGGQLAGSPAPMVGGEGIGF